MNFTLITADLLQQKILLFWKPRINTNESATFAQKKKKENIYQNLLTTSRWIFE